MSTRLIVKNLPSKISDTKLKEHFSAKGTVTDVQLKYLSDGKFRHFGFVGFKTPEEAEAARSYFDKTFFGATRMQVETCYALNDPSKPKVWSKKGQQKMEEESKTSKEKRSADGEENGASKPKKKKKEEELLQKCKEDPAFVEFLELHKKDKAKWGNDTIFDTLEKLATSDGNKKSKKKKKVSAPGPEEDLEEDEGFEDVKVSKKKKKEREVTVNESTDKDDVEMNDIVDEEIMSKKESKLSKQKNRNVSNSINNDDDDESQMEESSSSNKVKTTKKEKCLPETEYFTVKLRDIPQKAKKKDVKTFFAPLVPNSIRMPPSIKGIAYVGFRNEQDQKKALIKNKSILMGNQVSVKKYVSQGAIDKTVQQKVTRWESQKQDLEKEAEVVEESGRIFIRNLAYTVKEDDIRSLFEPYGTLTEVHLPLDRITRQIKGFGFVAFFLPEHAKKAYEALDGTSLQGRMLHLLPSKSKEELSAEDIKAGSSYKREKELKQKKSAGSSHNWNTLFIGQNAVSEVTAKKYGVSREQLLLDNNDERDNRVASVAVRMALAETEVVAETKKFLEENGVCLEAFESSGNKKPDRSRTIILVKNLVAATTEEELRESFEKFGPLGRVLMPKSGITAIVEFLEPAEARTAFQKLAYSKFKGMPLYLEWAPVGVFRITAEGKKIPVQPSNSSAKDAEKQKEKPVESITTKRGEIILPTIDDDDEPFDENMVPESDTTLFVKNLNFGTAEEAMKKHFSMCGRVFAVTVARKKDVKNPGKLLSQGFGFVQYYRTKDAKRALDTLSTAMLENHELELKPSSRTLHSEKDATEKSKEQKGTKILVRNVPFEADKDEIIELFNVFGKLKDVRMPKKLSGEKSHRGFAFVEFFSEQHAKAAFEVLSKSSHLYTRRLVLEWAQADESVEELREKVAKRYNLQRAGDNSSDTTSTKKKMQRYFETHGPKASSSGRDEDEEEIEDDE